MKGCSIYLSNSASPSPFQLPSSIDGTPANPSRRLAPITSPHVLGLADYAESKGMEHPPQGGNGLNEFPLFWHYTPSPSLLLSRVNCPIGREACALSRWRYWANPGILGTLSSASPPPLCHSSYH